MSLSRRAAVSSAAGIVVAAVAAGFGARSAQAQKDNEPAPPLEKWLADVTERKGAFPFAVAFVSELPAKGKGPPKFLALDTKALSEATYMRLADAATVDWDMKLNRAAYEEADAAEVALKVAHADTLVLAPAKGPWQFIQVGKGGKRETLKKVKAPKSTKVEDIIAWLPSALNWDGVVLDQKGDYLLVGSTSRILSTPQTQALAIAKSASKFSVSASERKGAGLLSLGEFKGGVGIFDIVFLGQGVATLPAGTKLIIEKKKS